ncbi:MAG: GAF domain-containing protein [Chloroflexota bacterium]|nr:GAF domain-containing protein [Chloroflexota bacterium]
MAISPTDAQPVLDAIAANAVAFCGAEDAIVALREGHEIRIAAHHGPLGTVIGEHLPLDADRPVARAIRDGLPVHVTDLMSSQDPAARERARRIGLRAVSAVPLRGEAGVIGALALARSEPRPFSDEQLQLLRIFADQAVIALENVRLFNETKEALEQQTAVAEVLKSISQSAFDLEPVLQATVDHGVKLCRAERGHVYLAEREVLRLVTSSGSSPQEVAYELAHPNPRARNTAAGRAALDRTTVHIPDVLADPEYQWPEAQRLGGYRTLLSVPIKRDDDVVGVIGFARNAVKPFSEREIQLVEVFAAQAAIAIENVRLFNETKEALEQQTATSNVLQTISRSTFDLRAVLETVVENVTKLCRAQQGLLYRLEGDVYSLAAAHGLTSQAFREFSERHPIDPANRGTVTGRAASERRIIHVPDVLADPDYTYWEAQRLGGFRTLLGVPMLREGIPIGIVDVWRTEPEPFTEAEIRLVRTFADQAVVAIENVRLFNEIEEKSRQLEVANRHKSEFLANMSHELRTPLNAVIGFSEVLLEQMFGPLNDKQLEYLRDIETSGRHLLSLINDILDLSKIEAGRMELQPGTFSLPDALEAALVMVRERASRHRIDLRLQVGPDLSLVEGDERKVKQVLFNLLSNAVKFTPEGGRVEISAVRSDGDARVAVRDTGIGIEPEDQRRIFEEFLQARSRTSQPREGTGLGLALAKRFVELHGGRIWVDSVVGRGSTFTFTLPLRAGEASERGAGIGPARG